jgi:hypothetical protein
MSIRSATVDAVLKQVKREHETQFVAPKQPSSGHKWMVSGCPPSGDKVVSR